MIFYPKKEKDSHKKSDWNLANKSPKPFPYDLLQLKCEDKTISGWWTGTDWFSKYLKEGDEVIMWRKAPPNFFW